MLIDRGFPSDRWPPFVNHLEDNGLLFTPKGRKDLVKVTDRGRKVFSKYAGEREFAEELMSFFAERPSA